MLAVLRRGPSDWFHVGRWDVAAPAFEPGAWIRATLYPQKCDLSPDGRWLVVSVHDGRADWPAGEVYEAVSRLPWLHALAAWEEGTTYTRGVHFTEKRGECALGTPEVGDAAPLLRRYGIALNPPGQFSVERRHGWSESPDSEPRDPSDVFDEQRAVRMRKPRPGDEAVWLEVEGSYAGMRSFPEARTPAAYALWRGPAADPELAEPLGDVQWADWDARGRLLVATASGRLQIHDDPLRRDPPVFDCDLVPLRPGPVPAPDWARQW